MTMDLPDGIVGRDRELAELDAALGSIRRGRFLAAAITGEPGIGKSRLLAELGTRADRLGMLVLSGRASEYERDLPFWLFVDALDEYLRSVPAGRLAALTVDERSELAHVLPSWPPVPERQVPAGTDARYRTHRAIRRVLELLAEPVPAVLLLDDVHWADTASVELLSALLRRPPTAGLLLAITYRPRQVPGRLVRELDGGVRGNRAGQFVRLQLGRLSLDDAGRLLGHGVEPRRLAGLHAKAGGNPFYLRQLAQAPRRTGTPARWAEQTDELPPMVADALSDELDLLEPAIRQVLDGAAVAGDPFGIDLAAAASGLPQPAVIDALDDLQRRDLIRPTDVPRRFGFRHPLVRRAAYESVPGAWRVAAHGRCAEALAARGAPAAARAHHTAQAARHGDRSAVALLRAAGDAAVPRAPGEAARWYRHAIELLPYADQDDRFPILVALAGSLGAAGRLPEARTTLLDALDLVPTDDLPTWARLSADCAALENVLGHHESAHRRLVSALARLPDRPSTESVMLLVAIAMDQLYHLDHHASVAWAGRASDSARETTDPVALAHAATALALVTGSAGDLDRAASACADAARLVDTLPDEVIGLSPDPIVVRLAGAELFSDRYAEASRHAERGLAVVRAAGSLQHLPVMFWAGVVRTAQGRLGEACTVLDEGIDVAESFDHPSLAVWLQVARSIAASALGDVPRALEAATAATGPADHTLPAAWAGLARGAALLESGDPAGAEGALAPIAPLDEPLLPQPMHAAALDLLTRCRLASGNVTGAAAAADAALALTAAPGTVRALAERASAAVDLRSGDRQRAATRARSAAEMLGSVGAAFESARSRELAGRALAEAGDNAASVAEVEHAAAGYAACGAPRRVAAAERLLRRLGQRRPGRRSRPGTGEVGSLDALTERELQIARLITARRTNAEIASELFLSPKTVETHISHLFTKLAVSSRVDVARAVEEADRRRPDDSAQTAP